MKVIASKLLISRIPGKICRSVTASVNMMKEITEQCLGLVAKFSLIEKINSIINPPLIFH